MLLERCCGSFLGAVLACDLRQVYSIFHLMSSSEDVKSLSREDLLALVAEQQRQIAQLTATIEALRAEIAQLKRSTKRQAAPFAKATRVSHPNNLPFALATAKMLPVAVSPPGKTTWRASLCAETGRYLYFSERNNRDTAAYMGYYYDN
jgi:cell division protein FtsB